MERSIKRICPQDIQLKCWECGDRFTFSIGEQKFFKDMGFQWPKRCEKCRLERKFGELF
ncbi:zinc-ribbon domain containing protein [Lentibacillus daqui]|uniref:zinc-ribbon domain containing protein n=1 Tax=Lentibacillus daqui TaxID=2911514 RepID=UPI0022B206FC|nr:zinc-ribbon domain containing protein [Lentibacillus daqui]